MTESPVSRALMPVARTLALLAGYSLLGLSFLVTAEILLRRFLNFSLQGGDEFGGYVLAVIAAFGFAYTLLERAHTRVEILVERVSPMAQAWLNVLSSWGVAGMGVFLAWRAGATLLESVEFKSLSGTPMMTPLWQPQSLWFFGLLFFALVSCAVAIHSCMLLFSGSRRLNDLYGIKTLNEIIEEETASALEPREALVK
jgi:TRAP-type mannitol/chloroaromatic compound transport system permease small subunit